METSRFCGGDEEHDPSEEFEEYLACAVCGDNCMFFVSFSRLEFIFLKCTGPKLINVTFMQPIGNVHETLTLLGWMMVCKDMTNTRQTEIDNEI
jgi:hypothetical protein